MRWLYNLYLATDQWLNAFLGGNPTETISARCWRESRTSCIKIINTIFFWQANHCRGAYAKQIARLFVKKEKG